MDSIHSRNTRARATGFTLIELLIALAVVGILAAVVIPTYNSSVNKSRRAECRSALVLAAQNEERYFTTNNVYAPLATAGAATYSGNTAASSACTLTAYAGSTATAASQTAVTSTTNTLVIVAQPQNWTDSQCNASYYALDSTGDFKPLVAGLAVQSPITPNCF